MFFSDTAAQLSFLFTVCFSFYILLSSFWYKNSPLLPRFIGVSFSVPLLCFVTAFMSPLKSTGHTLTALAEAALLLIIFLLLMSKPEKNFGEIVFLTLVFSLILIFISYRLTSLQSFMQEPVNRLLLVAVTLLPNLYILRKGTGQKRYLLRALLAFGAAAAAGCYYSTGLPAYLSPLLKLTAYVFFTVYFYKEYYEHMLMATEEARKRIASVNRNLELEVKKRTMEVERVNQNLLNKAKTDALSTALNKAAILDAIETLLMARGKSEFSIMMFDIDNFKQINDAHGHVTGDKCIRTLSLTAKSNLREFDMIGRYGGDEFVIVLPGTGLNHAMQIAERFRKAIEKTETPHYTISIGVASYPKDGTTVKALIEAADRALYKSKDMGRNRVTHIE